jgi:hypothetical protein
VISMPKSLLTTPLSVNLNGQNKTVDGCLQRTDDDAVINVSKKYHILLEIKARIDFRWGEASINQTLLQHFKQIKTGLFQTI